MNRRRFHFVGNLALTVMLAQLALAGANDSPNLTKLERGWRLISAREVQASGAQISQQNFDASRWYAVKRIPSTVLQALQDADVYKIRIGRSLLLGLEVLVAADIVKTIAHELSVMSLGLLAGLVLVRTFLSWTLVLEIEGRWPWQREPSLMSSRARSGGNSEH